MIAQHRPYFGIRLPGGPRRNGAFKRLSSEWPAGSPSRRYRRPKVPSRQWEQLAPRQKEREPKCGLSSNDGQNLRILRQEPFDRCCGSIRPARPHRATQISIPVPLLPVVRRWPLHSGLAFGSSVGARLRLCTELPFAADKEIAAAVVSQDQTAALLDGEFQQGAVDRADAGGGNWFSGKNDRFGTAVQSTPHLNLSWFSFVPHPTFCIHGALACNTVVMYTISQSVARAAARQAPAEPGAP